MSDRARSILATVALALGALCMLGSVGFALVAALQGSSGGATAFFGFLATAPLSLFTLVLGIVSALLARERSARWRALAGLGLALLAPVVFVGLVFAFVPASAFRI
jgi:hypothetical protein